MKNVLLLVFFMLVGLANIQYAEAQTHHSLNADLRRLFSHIKVIPSTDDEPFLWDMSVHTTKEAFYDSIVPDTSSTDNWRALYFEMYHSAYVTTTLPDPGVLLNFADNIVHNDTIPMGIFDCGYNTFLDSAFAGHNGTYLAWNNDSAWLLPGKQPFKQNPSLGNYRFTIFSAAPMVRYSKYKNVNFKLDANFIFAGTSFNLNAIRSSDSVQIDFGDGNGWRYVHLASHPTIHIDYPYKGTFYIKVRVVRDVHVIRSSVSRFEVYLNEGLTQPDYYLTNIHGITAGVYLGCGHDSIKKPVIFLEGIDPFETRHVPEIYQEMLNDAGLNMLRNYGYDFVVVDWNKSTDHMADNALRVQNLIEYLETKVHDTTQFIVIGESMGGVVGRYTLTSMETSNYINGVSGVSPPHPKSHNTRLFITIDAPQQGAVVPLAFQQAVDNFYALSAPQTEDVPFLYDMRRKAQSTFNQGLNMPAVKELLIQHDLGRNFDGTYSDMSEKTSFFSALKAMNPASGGYPVHCKKLALSNGLMDGRGQVGFRDSVIKPGDRYLDVQWNLKVRFLRLFFLDIDTANFTLKAEPNGTGVFYTQTELEVDYALLGCAIDFFTTPKSPVLCKFTIPHTQTISATSVKPLETSAGGFYGSIGADIRNPTGIFDANNYDNDWLVFSDQYTIDPTSGTVSFGVQTGVILADLCFKTTLTADIVNFCFIPYTSSLDYQSPPGLPLNHDILNDNIDTTLKRTPYDVIVGWPTDTVNYPGLGFFECENFAHLTDRNDTINGSLLYPAGYLNREIGDSRMNLDNLWMNRPALFQASQVIVAGNEESPYYDYTDKSAVRALGRGGAFSKNAKFIDDSVGGDVVFKAGREIRLEPGFEARQGCRFWAHIRSEDTCNYTSVQLGSNAMRPEGHEIWDMSANNEVADYTAPTGEVAFSVYPNPSKNIFTVTMPPAANAKATVFNSFGEEIVSFEVSNQKQFTIDPAKYMLTNGIYFLSVHTSETTYTQKLIVNH